VADYHLYYDSSTAKWTIRRSSSGQSSRSTGQACVRINDRDFYLGKFDSEDSRQRYDDLIGKWLADQDPQGLRLTLDDLCLLYIAHGDTYYRKPDGRPTGEARNVRAALRPLLVLFGTTRARDFSICEMCKCLLQTSNPVAKF